jgi:hypothetical protein
VAQKMKAKNAGAFAADEVQKVAEALPRRGRPTAR